MKPFEIIIITLFLLPMFVGVCCIIYMSIRVKICEERRERDKDNPFVARMAQLDTDIWFTEKEKSIALSKYRAYLDLLRDESLFRTPEEMKEERAAAREWELEYKRQYDFLEKLRNEKASLMANDPKLRKYYFGDRT